MSRDQLIPTWEEMTSFRQACQDLIDAAVALNTINHDPLSDSVEFIMYFEQYMRSILAVREFLGPLSKPPSVAPRKRIIYSRPLIGWPGLVKSQFRIIENRFDEICTKVDLEELSATWSRVGYNSDGTRRNASKAPGPPPGQPSGASSKPQADRDPTLTASYRLFERAVKALGLQLDALSSPSNAPFLYSTLAKCVEGNQAPEPNGQASAPSPSQNGRATPFEANPESPTPSSPKKSQTKDVDRQVVEILETLGRRLTKTKFLAEFERHGREKKEDYPWSEQTVVNALVRLNRDGVIDNRRDTKPRGYGLPHWKDGGPNAGEPV